MPCLPTSPTARPGDLQRHPLDGLWICGQGSAECLTGLMVEVGRNPHGFTRQTPSLRVTACFPGGRGGRAAPAGATAGEAR